MRYGFKKMTSIIKIIFKIDVIFLVALSCNRSEVFHSHGQIGDNETGFQLNYYLMAKNVVSKIKNSKNPI